MHTRALHILLLLIAGMLAAACGQQAQAVPAVAPAPVPTVAPQPAPVASDLAAIPQSQTDEGYQILGAADAPVTLVMYSDYF